MEGQIQNRNKTNRGEEIMETRNETWTRGVYPVFFYNWFNKVGKLQ